MYLTETKIGLLSTYRSTAAQKLNAYVNYNGFFIHNYILVLSISSVLKVLGVHLRPSSLRAYITKYVIKRIIAESLPSHDDGQSYGRNI